MAKGDFTNNEIELMFKEIKLVLEHQNTVLTEIKEQVKKTNGRVTVLEMWRETMMAKITMVLASVGVVWALLKQFFFK